MAYFMINILLLFLGSTCKFLKENSPNICHKSCKTCFGSQIDEKNMNCETCIDNYFITEDTNSCYNLIPNNYYLDRIILRRCHPKCSKCSTGSIDDCIDNYSSESLTNDDSANIASNIERKTTWFFWVFVIILTLAFSIAGCIVFCPKTENN